MTSINSLGRQRSSELGRGQFSGAEHEKSRHAILYVRPHRGDAGTQDQRSKLRLVRKHSLVKSVISRHRCRLDVRGYQEHFLVIYARPDRLIQDEQCGSCKTPDFRRRDFVLIFQLLPEFLKEGASPGHSNGGRPQAFSARCRLKPTSLISRAERDHGRDRCYQHARYTGPCGGPKRRPRCVGCPSGLRVKDSLGCSMGWHSLQPATAPRVAPPLALEWPR